MANALPATSPQASRGATLRRRGRLRLLVGIVLLQVALAAAAYTCYLLFFDMLAMSLMQDYKPMKSWIQDLKHEDAEVRNQAAAALGRLGPEALPAVPALCAAAKDEVTLVRLNVVFALYKIGPEARAAVPVLSEALADEEPLIRMDAAMALHRIGPAARAGVPALIEALQREENWPVLVIFRRSIRHQAVAALGRIGRDARTAVPCLMEAIQDPKDDALRMYAAEALGGIGPEAVAAVPLLTQAMEDRNEEVRASAAIALKKINPPKATVAGDP